MKCINQYCDANEIEDDDNFCYKCGHWTARGYSLINHNKIDKIIDKKHVNQNDKFAYLFALFSFSMILVIGSSIYRGQNILKPFIFLKRQVVNYKYGYDATILRTDNQYFNMVIHDIDDAEEIIKSDFNKQKWQCKSNIEVRKLEKKLEDDFNIPSVSFCDVSPNEAKQIYNVISSMYELFPGIDGYLTNISITNSDDSDSYVAYFQPIYQFVNRGSNILEYNRVNKTQILLNSYYFANDDVLNNNVKDNWYVKDSTWESLIAHEIGHYITYVTFLKSKKITNMTLVTKDNIDSVDEIINVINNQEYSLEIVNEAINNYNLKYDKNVSASSFASNISNYASAKNSNGEFIYDEIIAEAVHDYYLHGYNASKESMQIIDILKSRLK